MERIFSTLLPYCRPGPEGQLAAKALEKGSPVPSRPAASPAFQLTSCPGLHARPIPPPSGGRAPPSAASVPSLTFQFNLSQDAIFRAHPPIPRTSPRLTTPPHHPTFLIQNPREGEGAGGRCPAPPRSSSLLHGWGKASGTALWGNRTFYRNSKCTHPLTWQPMSRIEPTDTSTHSKMSYVQASHCL